MTVTYEKLYPKLVKVSKDGVFAGYLEQDSRKSSGLSGQRYTFWSGMVFGSLITAPSLTAAKALVATQVTK